MSIKTGDKPTITPQLTFSVALLFTTDPRSGLVTTAQLDAIAALVGTARTEVAA